MDDEVDAEIYTWYSSVGQYEAGASEEDIVHAVFVFRFEGATFDA